MYLEESMVKSIGLNTYNDDILSFLDSKIKSFYNLTQGWIWRNSQKIAGHLVCSSAKLSFRILERS